MVTVEIEEEEEDQDKRKEFHVLHPNEEPPQEEIEFDAKILKAGNTIGVSTVEVRKKKTGKIVAQARHAKYIAFPSKL
ncbi:hypothetical protein MA16_Dca024107 [Dendrobium catenatum]|uniref:Uncharacterized protein n=1 Tax=Dendrobium catenatum TaxID=906689 RepID=A0A2I0VA03_9ASPA|nr:hypothetical protein MA16_Dca024107 [Dendrobium catenatum]